MTSPFSNNGDDEMDRSTSAVICHAIGERLRQDMGTDEPLPSRLQMLLSELRQRDGDSA
ncbi:hypothetical protein [Rhodopseudomonas boonkerdii]|uniref:hypothetical protein n=1 Tax=Rhodopseudomonas boonkerdii TaxID=475937 RepID=UPI001E655B0A|nr:hypothetical protein [Rhodopseudomonas boonkerdii]